ncbi:MAG: hypothetical protein RLZ12_447 [Bacillota bacterium]
MPKYNNKPSVNIKNLEFKKSCPLPRRGLAGGFNTERALFLICCIEQAYLMADKKPASIPLGWTKLLCNEDLFIIKNNTNTELVMAFKGTTSFFDVQLDANIAKHHLWPLDKSEKKPYRVHAGFYDGYTKIIRAYNTQINFVISQLIKFPKMRLYITGHSLGAAYATLCAFDLAASYSTRLEVYTFGSPRVGSPSFAAAYNELLGCCSYLVRNEMDPIVYLPFGHMDIDKIKRIPTLGSISTTLARFLSGMITKAALDPILMLAAILGPTVVTLLQLLSSSTFLHTAKKYRIRRPNKTWTGPISGHHYTGLSKKAHQLSTGYFKPLSKLLTLTEFLQWQKRIGTPALNFTYSNKKDLIVVEVLSPCPVRPCQKK